MQGELAIPGGLLLGFLLVFTRIAGIFIFVPIPGVRSGLEFSRIVLALSVTIGLFSRWPRVDIGDWSGAALVPLIIGEVLLGQTIGLAVAVVSEAFLMGAQIVSVQAGFGYAAMVDPTTQAESTTLLVLAQLTAGLLFFATGFDREIIRVFILSLDTYPPGSFPAGIQVTQWIALLGSIFSIGLRIALPAIALLIMVDLAFGLLSRINMHLHLLSLLLSGKILLTLAVLGAITAVYPEIFRELSGRVLRSLHGLIGV